MSKLEVALREFPSAVRRLAEAAADSLEEAHVDRASTRRERMVTRSNSQIPSDPEGQEIEMPEEWRDDEITRKISHLKE